jgi:hypothetical protein
MGKFLQSFFATSFPLQGNSWRAFRWGKKRCLRIFSELRGKTSTLGPWLRNTMKGSAIGNFGPNLSKPSREWTPCSPMMCQTPTELTSLRVKEI